MIGHSMFGKTFYLGLSAALLLISGPGAAEAQTRADLIPLGRSAASGAVCQAVRDYDDPVVQAAGRRAWNIRCRGWEGSLGRLYALPKATDAGVWETALADGAKLHLYGKRHAADGRKMGHLVRLKPRA